MPDGFPASHSERVRRSTGRVPAPSTLRMKASNLNVCCTVVGADT